ncbi:MAG: hypothetical protein CMP92_00305 [Gammaproteobacteria bacterium]|nr:hypothetical protein [Gammaproteobacteria bacterium]|tara:strand:- start:462 stop:827 length:366 start_codon:yes stop_codon:yes gene_type:complete
MSKITKEDIDWDNFPAFVAGSSEPKVLSEEEKDWIVENHNNEEEMLKNDPTIIKGTEDEQRARMLRNVRNDLLSQSDWTQQPDVAEETRTKWQPYRQALRDLPTHENWPNLEESDLPTKPE